MNRALPRPTALGLTAVVFDLDGVVTRTATVHAAAWAALFDGYLQERAARTGEPFRPFDRGADYTAWVDGKPRYDGVAAFLESRGIRLPWGDPADPPEADTVCGLGNRKNALFHEALAREPVEVFPGARRFITACREAGLACALCSSSKNARAVLEKAGLTALFDVVVDGVHAAEHHLPGKPAPDTFLAAARMVGAEPSRAAVVEDAVVGVEAGRAGGFALVIGIDRGAGADALLRHGADIVVTDLGEFERV